MSNKRTPPILLITGQTGSGKTKFLTSIRHAYIVDPLQEPTANRKKTWQEPDLDTVVDLVAFDHVTDLQEAQPQLDAAIAWCAAHDKALWIISIDLRDLKALGCVPKRNWIEMRITRKYDFPGSGDDDSWLSFFDDEGHEIESSFVDHGDPFGLNSARVNDRIESEAALDTVA